MTVNWLLVVLGCGIIGGASATFRHRVPIYRMIIEGQRAMVGERAVRWQDRATPMTGVGVPAVFGVIVGVGFILGGVFGLE